MLFRIAAKNGILIVEFATSCATRHRRRRVCKKNCKPRVHRADDPAATGKRGAVQSAPELALNAAVARGGPAMQPNRANRKAADIAQDHPQLSRHSALR